ncbi:MAG: hypothetical protein AAGL98_07230, partial [Planctomycetota bacterium]
ASVLVIAAISISYGVGYWAAYIGDLATVAISDVRAKPGVSFKQVVSAPAYVAGSILLVVSVIALRQAGRATEGVILLLLVPGFFYVTYQNFGNDPQWLFFLAVLLLTSKPEDGAKGAFGWDLSRGLPFLGALALALSAPSFLNLASSPVRHAAFDAEDFSPFLEGQGRHETLRALTQRVYTTRARTLIEDGLTAFEGLGQEDEIAEIAGKRYKSCYREGGSLDWFRAVAADLAEAGHEGRGVFVTDVFGSVWLHGSFRRLKGGAPWFYKGLPGLKDADFVLVPLCPIHSGIRLDMLADMTEQDIPLELVREAPLYDLFRVERSPQG